MLAGSGDIARDMENQVKANSTRIALLEAQNNKLRGTITKLLQSRHKTSPPPQSEASRTSKVSTGSCETRQL